MFLQKLLCDQGYPLTTRDDFEHVRMIKESLCYVALDPLEEEQKSDIQMTYTLPEGMTLRDGVTTEITVGPERFYTPEALFEPHLVHRDNIPLTELIWQSIQTSAIDQRKSLMGTVMLSGGSSLFPGLPERLEKEMKLTSPLQARGAVKVHASDDRLFGVWLGARFFCEPNLRPMQDHLWITKDEWAEIGPNVVHEKVALKGGG